MTILVIDGQGGSLGRSLIAAIQQAMPDVEIVAVGTNAMATAAMLKAGPSAGATGENAVVYNASRCDAIVAPIGLIAPNAMYGEVSPAMAEAVGRSDAPKVLIPSARSNIRVAGVQARSIADYVAEAARLLKETLFPVE